MKTVGVVLAGGLSTRMQSNKSQLLWQDKTLLDHTSQLLIDSGCSKVIISDNNDPEYIKDRYLNSGPLAGIDACLNFIQNNMDGVEAMLIMPVDMPLMSVELLSNLLGQSTSNDAVFYNLGRFPLLLAINEQLVKLLINALEKHKQGRGVSIRQILAQLQCHVLDLDKDQETAFFNCNTPEDWQNLTSK